MRRGIDRHDGFTLLEVLAAAMFFALIVTVLISSSSQAIHRAGVVATRLEAAGHADRELARLEALFAQRLKPPEDREEQIEGEVLDFVLRVTSTSAFDDLGGGSGPGGGASADSLLAALSGGGGIGPMLAAQAPGIDLFLRRYTIEVRWAIDDERSDAVERVTYGFDWESAQVALPELFVRAEDGTQGLEGAEALPEGAEALIEQIQGAGGSL